MELHEKLSALRKKKGLSQMEVSEELNVSRQAVSKWEVGYTTPSVENLIRLSCLYQVPLEYLVNRQADEISEAENNTGEALIPEPVQRRERFWKRLAVLALILCAVLTAALFCLKAAEKPVSDQSAILFDELEADDACPSGGFELEW